jgi:hypothetical protein
MKTGDYIVVGGTTEENRAETEKHENEVKKDRGRSLMARGFRTYETDISVRNL